MTADNRANPGAGHTFNPDNGGQSEQPPRTPQRSSLRPMTGDVPVSGYQPVSAPSAVPRSGAFAPVSGAGPAPNAQPVAQPYTPSPATPPTAPHAAGGAAGAGASATGFDRIKDFAAKAKEDLTSADDIAASKRQGGPRRVRVLVSRIDPWSSLKIGFLLSIALGIMLVVAVYVLWGALNSLGVFALANEWVLRLFDDSQNIDLLQFFELNKWMSAAVLIAVVNVVLLTALSTVGAFLYNTISKVVGGFYVTLTDD